MHPAQFVADADTLTKLAEIGSGPSPPSPTKQGFANIFDDPVEPSTSTSSGGNTAASAGAAQGATSVSATGGGSTASTAAGGKRTSPEHSWQVAPELDRYFIGWNMLMSMH